VSERNKNNDQQDIQTLLRVSKISFLATLGKHGPETSMAPFAMHQGLVLLHLSRLAKHTSNIDLNPNIGIMICTPESEASSPLALPRLSLQGEVKLVTEDQYPAAQAAYLQQIPDAEQLFSFADFKLFQFSPSYIYWVGGFGKARKVPLEQWEMVSASIQGCEG